MPLVDQIPDVQKEPGLGEMAELFVAVSSGKIDAILMSGPCQVGIESTVIDMTGDTPMILRPGILTKAD